jgi:hypothetical protein
VCLDQRWISTIMARVCDGPEDVSDDMNKDHYSCPGGRGNNVHSCNDTMSWIRQNCDYPFVLTPSPTVHNSLVARCMGFWNKPRCRCQWKARGDGQRSTERQNMWEGLRRKVQMHAGSLCRQSSPLQRQCLRHGSSSPNSDILSLSQGGQGIIPVTYEAVQFGGQTTPRVTKPHERL